MKELSKVQLQRRANLQLLIEDHGSAVALATALGFKTQSRVSHLLGTKGMGERAARDIEMRLKLPDRWMDSDAEGRKPVMPNSDWLVSIYLVLSKNKNVSRMSTKKLKTIIDLSYATAVKTGRVDHTDVDRLIALTE